MKNILMVRLLGVMVIGCAVMFAMGGCETVYPVTVDMESKREMGPRFFVKEDVDFREHYEGREFRLLKPMFYYGTYNKKKTWYRYKEIVLPENENKTGLSGVTFPRISGRGVFI